jgi:putative PIN family toxin of toxin-antitoxin system
VTQRVVFDTSTVISALLFENGRLAWLRTHWQQSLCQPFICRETALELKQVLSYKKFRHTPALIEEFLSDYLPYCTIAHLTGKAPILCRDAKDQKFLDLAHCVKANILVSSDKDLLALAGKTKFLIESPETYRRRFHQ